MDLKPILTRLNIDYAAVYQQLPTLMSGVFVVALSSTAANMVWTFVPVDERPVPASVSSSSLSRSGPVENRQQSDLSSWHLFGLADMAPPKEVAQEIPDEAPDTSLRLTLKGVYASDDPSRAWAIVAGSSGDDEIYRVESSLPGGAILKEVHPDKIILLRNGRFETLRMPEEVIAGVNESLPSRRASATQQNSVSSVVTPEAARVLNEYKQKLESDPQSVMSAVRAEPYRVGGDIKGYRVFPGRDKELLGQVGLKPGDVVTSVNGIELDNPLKGLEIMKQLKEASQVSVDVLRNGVNQTFVVPVN